MLFSVSGIWVRAGYGHLPPNATQFNDEFGPFYVAKATVKVELETGPEFRTLPADLRGSQAFVTYNGQALSTPEYEVSFCTYICVETEVTEGLDEFSH